VNTIGLISDTHGLIRPEALRALHGCERIVHAGDIGTPDVLDALEAIAPLFAVRGNVDHGVWADRLPANRVVEVDGVHLYVLHDLGQLDLDPAAAELAVVVSGHSHRPSVAWKEGILYVNPGSAGPYRFALPATLARLHLGRGRPRAEIIPLDP
jgi:putative phosphoesterase